MADTRADTIETGRELPVSFFGVLMLLAAFGPLATDTYLSAFPEMAHDLGTSRTEVASSLTVFVAGLAGGQLLYGPLSDRFGRKRPLLAGIAIYTLASAGCLLPLDLTGFLAMRLGQALGGCSGIILGRAMIRDRLDAHDVARSFSTLSMINVAMPLIAPAIGAVILWFADWQAIFVMLVGLGLAAFLAVAVGIEETLPASRRTVTLHPGATLAAYIRLLSNARFVWAALATAAASGTFFAFLTGSPIAFMVHFGFGRVEFTTLFTAALLAMAAGGQINRRWLARRTPAAITGGVLPALCLTAALLVPGIQTGPALACGLIVLVMAQLGFILPNCAASAMNACSAGTGSAAALLGAIQFAGGLVGSAASATVWLGDAFTMALVVAILPLGTAFAWWRYTRSQSRIGSAR